MVKKREPLVVTCELLAFVVDLVVTSRCVVASRCVHFLLVKWRETLHHGIFIVIVHAIAMLS